MKFATTDLHLVNFRSVWMSFKYQQKKCSILTTCKWISMKRLRLATVYDWSRIQKTRFRCTTITFANVAAPTPTTVESVFRIAVESCGTKNNVDVCAGRKSIENVRQDSSTTLWTPACEFNTYCRRLLFKRISQIDLSLYIAFLTKLASRRA